MRRQGNGKEEEEARREGMRGGEKEQKRGCTEEKARKERTGKEMGAEKRNHSKKNIQKMSRTGFEPAPLTRSEP